MNHLNVIGTGHVSKVVRRDNGAVDGHLTAFDMHTSSTRNQHKRKHRKLNQNKGRNR